VAGLALDQLLRLNAACGAQPVAKGRSVIFLHLHGGPSQIETFDPKMTAPSGVRSATGETATTLPGITYGGTFTRLAALAHRTSVVRSFRSGDANHDIKPIVCKDTLMANMGSLYARVVGANHPQTGMPTTAALFPRAIDEQALPPVEQFGKFTSSGGLGAAFAPFVPGAGGPAQGDMKLQLARTRLDDRRNLLSGLDKIQRDLDAGQLEGVDKFREQAYSTLLGGVAKAFDLSQEDPRTIGRYDTAPHLRPDQISRQWNNYKNYVDNGKSLGRLLLLARRLCEAGCGFVTVTTNFVWDNHADSNNCGVEEGMQYCGLPFDHAVSALVEDLEARGLSDKILLVATGEMGRTPMINKRGGRDHWGNLTPLFLYGGGLKMGQVIGQSTKDAGEPQTEPWGNKNLLATIMHTLLDVGQVRLLRNLPADLLQALTTHAPIAELV
jgi:hypothetical protein